MRLIFMGTPDFSVPVLEKLIEEGHEIGYAVTQPDRKRNRGRVTFSPVKEAALRHGIEVLQPERLAKDEEAGKLMAAYAPDAIIVVAFGQILKKDVLDLPRYGCFNVHGSILPELRGASPVQGAILKGLKETGVTIMKMDEGLDSGDIVAVRKTSVSGKTLEELMEELSVTGAELMAETLKLIENGTAVYTPQDHSRATMTGIIKKDDGRVNFTEDAALIVRMIHAYDPWPGTFFESGGEKIKLWRAETAGSEDAGAAGAPGTVTAVGKDSFDIACGKGALRIFELQLPGKKRVAAGDFLRGHSIEKGSDIRGILSKG